MKRLFLIIATALTTFYGNPALSADEKEQELLPAPGDYQLIPPGDQYNQLGALALQLCQNAVPQKGTPGLSQVAAANALTAGLPYNRKYIENRKSKQHTINKITTQTQAVGNPLQRKFTQQQKLRQQLEAKRKQNQ